MDELLSKLGLGGLEDQAGEIVWSKIKVPVIGAAAVTALVVVLLFRLMTGGNK